MTPLLEAMATWGCNMDRRAFVKSSTIGLASVIAGYHGIDYLRGQEAKTAKNSSVQINCTLNVDGEEKPAVVRKKMYGSGADGHFQYIVWVLPKEADQAKLADFTRSYQQQYFLSSKNGDFTKLGSASLIENGGNTKEFLGKQLEKMQQLYDQVYNAK